MRILGKSIIFVLIAFILVLVVNNYGFTPLGDAVHPEMKRAFEAHPVGIYAHISAGGDCIIAGAVSVPDTIASAMARSSSRDRTCLSGGRSPDWRQCWSVYVPWDLDIQQMQHSRWMP